MNSAEVCGGLLWRPGGGAACGLRPGGSVPRTGSGLSSAGSGGPVKLLVSCSSSAWIRPAVDMTSRHEPRTQVEMTWRIILYTESCGSVEQVGIGQLVNFWPFRGWAGLTSEVKPHSRGSAQTESSCRAHSKPAPGLSALIVAPGGQCWTPLLASPPLTSSGHLGVRVCPSGSTAPQVLWIADLQECPRMQSSVLTSLCSAPRGSGWPRSRPGHTATAPAPGRCLDRLLLQCSVTGRFGSAPSPPGWVVLLGGGEGRGDGGSVSSGEMLPPGFLKPQLPLLWSLCLGCVCTVTPLGPWSLLCSVSWLCVCAVTPLGPWSLLCSVP
nr:PREDICTED: uncharacterized protein LOC107079688 [Lepisosteus oculatus]